MSRTAFPLGSVGESISMSFPASRGYHYSLVLDSVPPPSRSAILGLVFLMLLNFHYSASFAHI
jgi:hypothetical protein